MTTSDLQKQQDLIRLAENVMLRNYRQQPMVLSRGQGAELWDVAGKRYLDMTAGISVCALGHSHPELAKTIAEQATRLVHTSNLYYNDQNILAAEAIVKHSFAKRVYFCNSGGEANEAALKLARRYAAVVNKEPGRQRIVATKGSFHGRTVATMSITGQDKYRAGFGSLWEPVAFVPFGDIEAAKAALSDRLACAYIVEPIQAEGGIIVPPAGYFAALRKLCDETGTLLIADEVQTGIGRTGKWFGMEWEGVAPDVMTLAKALGGGIPTGAIACTEEAAKGLTFVEGDVVPHASTFGGNPLASATVRTVFEVIARDKLLENVNRQGEYLVEKLNGLQKKYPARITATRGRGLLRGLELSGNAPVVITQCRERGMLLSIAGGTVLRFAPALIVEQKHIDEAINILDDVFAQGH